MNWLLDDRHLSQLLRSGRAAKPIRARDQLFTTGYWYVRLCQAVLDVPERPGALSAPFGRLGPGGRERAVAALVELPDEIGLVSLRTLAPLIGRLRRTARLNVLGMEALAACVYLEGHVLLSARSPRLEAALDAAGRACTVTDA